jgi:NADPH-dependent 2,4-dienoyl-CoA reductase/sulfur reductase-like enzyme
VTLYEAGRHVGGQALLAQALPGRAEFGGIVTNLEAEARRAGARIVTDVPVDAPMVAAESPDVVLVATGARPRWPALETMDDPVMLDVWQVLGGAEVPSGRVVVADFRCDWVGLGVAEHLARTGRRVTLAVDGYMAGQRIQQYVRDTMTASATRAGVEVLPLTRLVGADEDTVYLQHVLTGEPVLVTASSLVLAQGTLPDDTLLQQLTAQVPGARAPSFTSMEVPVPSDAGAAESVSVPTGHEAPAARQGPEVHGIGDVVSPRTAEEAVLDALRLASAI